MTVKLCTWTDQCPTVFFIWNSKSKLSANTVVSAIKGRGGGTRETVTFIKKNVDHYLIRTELLRYERTRFKHETKVWNTCTMKPWREVFPSPYLSLHSSPFFLAWQRHQTYSLNNSPSLLGEWLPVKVSSTHVIGFPEGRSVLWEIIANNKVGVTTSAMKQEPRLLGIPGPRRLFQTLGLFDEISPCVP